MADIFTACLQTQEATVKAILKAAPYNHTNIATIGTYGNGDLEFLTYSAGGAPALAGGVSDDGPKVLIYSKSA